ncbi:MAG: CofH family radical SAM protein [bacterium]|nr:CofH family radical SAM protein [bacterium]
MVELSVIKDKILADQRLSREEGLALMTSNEILALGELADIVRKRKVSDHAYFNLNLNINYTNICISKCPLCAFSKDLDDGYLLSLEEIEQKVHYGLDLGIKEFHIVGGLHPKLNLSYYEEMLRRIKKISSSIFLQAFTATEIDYISKAFSLEGTLKRLKEAGLDSIPGGGAEIFSQRVRQIISPNKISGKRWLEVMETAHKLGLGSNATMLYGHIETAEERVDHILQLRELQDRTEGFLAFVPLAFHPQNTNLSYCKGSSAVDDLRVFAVSRLLLDNITHIKGLWMYLGEKLVEVALSFGVDDIGGTGFEEKIVHSAGAQTPSEISKTKLTRIIKNAGRIPMEVNSAYQAKN